MSVDSQDLGALRKRVEDDPGGIEFPAFADALRRAGHLEEALAVAERGLDHAGDNVAGRVARALALLALDRGDDARGALEGVLETVPGWLSDEAILEPEVEREVEGEVAMEAASDADESAAEIQDDELDAAFDGAETDPDEMISANDIAERAMEEVEGPIFTAERHPTFVTETMAGLLERQGDLDSAQAIRNSIHGPPRSAFAIAGAQPAVDAAEVPAAAELVGEPRERTRSITLATLERWLANIQRGAR